MEAASDPVLTDAVDAGDQVAGGSIEPHASATQVEALLRLPLGLAILAAERIRGYLGTDAAAAGTVGAFLVGLGDVAVGAAGHAVEVIARATQRPLDAAAARATSGLRRYPLRLVADPANRLLTAAGHRAQATVVRGRTISAAARADAVAVLTAETSNVVTWARQQALPAVIDDLTSDPKVRELAVGQAQGALADAAREIRQRSASADGWIEVGVRRLLGRRDTTAASTEPQTAGP